MIDVEEPREGSSVGLPPGPGSSAEICDHGQLENFEAPTTTSSSLPEEVETNNVDEEPPGPPDARPETNPEPVATELQAYSLVPTAYTEEVEMGENAESFKRPQVVFDTVEVSWHRMEQITR